MHADVDSCDRVVQSCNDGLGNQPPPGGRCAFRIVKRYIFPAIHPYQRKLSRILGGRSQRWDLRRSPDGNICHRQVTGQEVTTRRAVKEVVGRVAPRGVLPVCFNSF